MRVEAALRRWRSSWSVIVPAIALVDGLDPVTLKFRAMSPGEVAVPAPTKILFTVNLPASLMLVRRLIESSEPLPA